MIYPRPLTSALQKARAPEPKPRSRPSRSHLEGVADDRADQSAGERDQHRIVARLDPAIAPGRRTQPVRIGIVDDPVVGRVASVEPVAHPPVAGLDLAALEALATKVAVDEAVALDLLLDPAAIVLPTEVLGRSGGRGGHDGSGGGDTKDQFLHFLSPHLERPIGVEREM